MFLKIIQTFLEVAEMKMLFLRKVSSKCPKILNTLFHIILAWILLFMQLFLKLLNGMANGVDPDQMSPSGAV